MGEAVEWDGVRKNSRCVFGIAITDSRTRKWNDRNLYLPQLHTLAGTSLLQVLHSPYWSIQF